MKGRFLASSALYPRHNRVGFLLNPLIIFNVTEGPPFRVGVDEDTTTCAFCFRTSAGVRMKQETHSAREEEMAWTKGVGM